MPQPGLVPVRPHGASSHLGGCGWLLSSLPDSLPVDSERRHRRRLATTVPTGPVSLEFCFSDKTCQSSCLAWREPGWNKELVPGHPAWRGNGTRRRSPKSQLLVHPLPGSHWSPSVGVGEGVAPGPQSSPRAQRGASPFSALPQR